MKSTVSLDPGYSMSTSRRLSSFSGVSSGVSGALGNFSSSQQHLRKQSQIRRQSMVKVELFDIAFDNKDAVYYGGEDVSGCIMLVLKEEKKINEILLELKGKAKTYWTKHSGKSRQHYTDSEPYFCEQFNTEYSHAFGKVGERILKAGRHEIPFSYKLPNNIPSSFEGEFGHVRYTCTATLERPWDFDIVCTRPFTCVGVEDLNDDKNASEHVQIRDDAIDVRYCFRKCGTVSVDLTLVKGGFVPGELIHIDALVKNDSSRHVKYVEAKLMMHQQYRAKSFLGSQETKQVDVVLVSVSKSTVLPNSVQKWTNQTLKVPAVPPKLVKCKVIDIYYSLQFEADPGLKVICPIFIGNVPVISDITSADHKVDTESTPLLKESGSVGSHDVHLVIPGQGESNSCDAEISNPVAIKYPTLPKPIFEDSCQGKYSVSEGRHDGASYGELFYAPKYPCYYFENAT